MRIAICRCQEWCGEPEASNLGRERGDGRSVGRGCLVRGGGGGEGWGCVETKVPENSPNGGEENSITPGLGQAAGLSQSQGCAANMCRYLRDWVNPFLDQVDPFSI